MADTITPEKRSEIMSRIRSRDTKPEMTVRRLVHGMGYRYRLHQKKLPGQPDLVFTPRKKVIFVHGCFWHMHSCPHGRIPKTRRAYWKKKLNTNVKRDAKQKKLLESDGWRVLVIWECETKELSKLKRTIQKFLG